jgi:hypothetical protein
MSVAKCSRCNQYSDVERLDADGNHIDPNYCIWCLSVLVSELSKNAGKVEMILGKMTTLLAKLTGTKIDV